MLGFLFIVLLGVMLWILYGRGALIVYKHRRDDGVLLPEKFDKYQVIDFLKKNLSYKDTAEIYFDENGEICIEAKYNTYHLHITDGKLCADRFTVEEDIKKIPKKTVNFWITLATKRLFDRKNAREIEELECIRAYIQKAFYPDSPTNARDKYIAMSTSRKYSGIIIALFVVLGIWLAVSVTNNIITSQVSDQIWPEYSSEARIGHVFEEFFAEPKWSWHRENSKTYVEFSGEFLYGDEPAEAVIIFQVDIEKGFRLDNIEIDGEENTLLGLLVIQEAYNNYDK